MKTLFVTDLDGTLLNKNITISDYSLSRLNKMIDEGLLFSFATARSVGGAKKVIKSLKLNNPVIVSNGVKIVDFLSEKILMNYYFTDSEVSFIKNKAIKRDILPISYQSIDGIDKFFYLDYKVSEGKRYYLDNRKNDKRINQIYNLDDLFPNNLFYFTFIDSYENLLDLYLDLKDHFTCIFQQEIYREEYWLEVIPNNIDKGIALKKLKEMLNVDKIIYFGDSLNDLYAYNYADIKIAVSNAKEEVKKKADIIIDSNDNDGVVKYIEKIFYGNDLNE